jgi:hypothetical protein
MKNQKRKALLFMMPARLAISLIRIYRYSLSAFAGRTCRHLPSCSEYTETAISKHGFWAGGWIGLSRLARCYPYGTSGFDPVPENLPARAIWYMPWRYGVWGRHAVPPENRFDERDLKSSSKP